MQDNANTLNDNASIIINSASIVYKRSVPPTSRDSDTGHEGQCRHPQGTALRHRQILDQRSRLFWNAVSASARESEVFR